MRVAIGRPLKDPGIWKININIHTHLVWQVPSTTILQEDIHRWFMGVLQWFQGFDGAPQMLFRPPSRDCAIYLCHHVPSTLHPYIQTCCLRHPDFHVDTCTCWDSCYCCGCRPPKRPLRLPTPTVAPSTPVRSTEDHLEALR